MLLSYTFKKLIDLSGYPKERLFQGHLSFELLTLCHPLGFFQLEFWNCSDILLFVQVALNLDTFTCNLETKNC